MGLPDDDRRALLTRLAPGGTKAADAVADAVDEGEELREIVVDAQGDVVAFTDRRALFVARGRSVKVVPVAYDAIELRRRVDTGLAIDVLMEGGRLVLDVARGTFARLAVVGTGAPPARGSWLPEVAPAPRPEPPAPAPAPPSAAAPTAVVPPVDPTSPSLPEPWSSPTAPSPAGPVPAPGPVSAQPAPAPAPAGSPPPGWHPDPAGRHWWRWWDGVDWTEHVADGGSPYVDPLPPRP